VQTWRVPSSVPVPPRQGEANLLVALLAEGDRWCTSGRSDR